MANNLFEPFYDSMRIAVPLFISQRKLDAEKEQADQLFKSRAAQILMQAQEAQSKVATESGMKMFEGAMQNIDPANPETVMRARAAAVNLERLSGMQMMPRDEAGEIVLPGVTWRKPGITEYQKESLDLRNQLAGQSQADREQARQDRMAFQNETLGLRRDALEAQKQRGTTAPPAKVPPGYRSTESGDLEAIPGGPADMKVQAKVANDKVKLDDISADLDNMKEVALGLKGNPGLDRLTGAWSKVPNYPGSEASVAEAKIENLKSVIAVSVMQKMKSASQTGATGFGALSEKELAVIQGYVASLDPKKLSTAELNNSLQKVADYAESAKNRFKKAYYEKLSTKGMSDEELRKQLGF